MPSNIGSQSIYVKFFDPVDSSVVNRIGVDVRKTGIYSGGYLTKINDSSVSLSTLSVEIGDGTYQVKITTGIAVAVAISPAAPVIVLRWIYTGSASVDYMDFVNVAPGGILTNDIVVGVGTYVGPTLQAVFDYTLRSTPNVYDLFLKVEPTTPTTMQVRVRAGRVNYGVANYDVVDQLTSAFVAPGSGSRIDVVYVDSDGVVKILPGTPSGSPVPPDYVGKVALCQITIPSGASSITASMIKDVRSFVSGSLAFPITAAGSVYGSALSVLSGIPSGAGVIPGVNTGLVSGIVCMWSGTVATIPSGWFLCDGSNGTPDLRDRFIVGARQDSGGVAKTNVSGSLTQSGGAAVHNHGAYTGYYGSTPNGVNTGGTPSLYSDHRHPISSDNNLSPYYALCFIMRA